LLLENLSEALGQHHVGIALAATLTLGNGLGVVTTLPKHLPGFGVALLLDLARTNYTLHKLLLLVWLVSLDTRTSY
jgi:hypothetical protein